MKPKYSVYADATFDTYPDGVRVTIKEGWWIRMKCALYLLFTGSFIVLGNRNITTPDRKP